VVSAADPYGRNLCFLDRRKELLLQTHGYCFTRPKFSVTDTTDVIHVNEKYMFNDTLRLNIPVLIGSSDRIARERKTSILPGTC
jgi:hypothetical protein